MKNTKRHDLDYLEETGRNTSETLVNIYKLHNFILQKTRP